MASLLPCLLAADKAIDLVDEACSDLQVQLESKPEKIDMLERRLIRLQVGVGLWAWWGLGVGDWARGHYLGTRLEATTWQAGSRGVGSQ
jgi:hypothetical protein